MKIIFIVEEGISFPQNAYIGRGALNPKKAFDLINTLENVECRVVGSLPFAGIVFSNVRHPSIYIGSSYDFQVVPHYIFMRSEDGNFYVFERK